jgi:aquaporin Z
MPTWREHLVEYAAEAWALGLFMVSACGFGVLLFHPASPVVAALPEVLARQMLMGAAMGLTAIANIYSPWGRRSGAHMNPAVTLTFWRLGKVSTPDLAGYVAAQFAGGVLGTALAAAALTPWIADPSVNYVITTPGRGVPAAFAAEVLISALLMLTVRTMSSHPRLERWTGLGAGLLVAVYIVVEAPISGMSMNPARTAGSAVLAGIWTSWWVYFLAPTAGMLLGAAVFGGVSSRDACAKYRHDPAYRCVFCEYQAEGRSGGGA